MPGDLSSLASKASSAKRFNCRRHAAPNESAAQVPKHRVAARMSDIVHSPQEIGDQGKRDHRPRGLWGLTEVAEDPMIAR